MKNNLVIVPRPIELENEHLLNDHEKIQTYFDEEIKPKLEELIRGGYDCVPFRQEFKYGAYVQSALKKAGWQIKWDSYTGPSGSWLISRRKPFQLILPSLTGLRLISLMTGIVSFGIFVQQTSANAHTLALLSALLCGGGSIIFNIFCALDRQ